MKNNFKILLATHIRGKWWRVDYVNKEGKAEFETVEALDSHEAQVDEMLKLGLAIVTEATRIMTEGPT